MPDPKFGGQTGKFTRLRETLEESSALKNLEKEARDLGQTEERVAEAEEAASRKRGPGNKTRKDSVDVINAQITSLRSLALALEAENDLLKVNTGLWRSNVNARKEQVAARGSFGPLKETLAEAGAPADASAARNAERELGRRAVQQTERELAAREDAFRKLSQAGIPGYVPPRPVLGGGGPGPLLLPRAPAPYEAYYESQASLLPSSTVGREGRFYGPERRPEPRFVAGTSGPAQITRERSVTSEYAGGKFTETAPLGQYVNAEKSLIAANTELYASAARVEAQQRATNRVWRESVAEVAAASQATTRHGALTSEFIQSLVRGEATLKEFGAQLTTTIGKFAGWAVAGGLVYGAFEALKKVAEGAKAVSTGTTQLERAAIPGYTRPKAEAGILDLSRKTNISVAEASEAAFFAARSGFNRNLPDTFKGAETIVKAQKLDQVPIQDAARGLGAVAIAFDLNADQISHVFDELDKAQNHFNARVQQTLPYVGRTAAAWAAGGGSVQRLIEQIVELTGVIPGGGGGGGSGSPATFFTRELSNLKKPQSRDVLRRYGFNPDEAVDVLNENIQNAFGKGVTPSGAKLTRDVQENLAQALGNVLGPRYGIPFLRQGQIDPETGLSRAQRIRTALRNTDAEEAQHDLNIKLSEFDEKAKAVGHTLERLGAEVGKVGFTELASAGLTLFSFVGKAAEVGLAPLSALGQTLHSLPGPVTSVIVGLGLLAGALRLLDTGVGKSVVGIAGGFRPGFLGGNQTEELRNFSRTTNEGLRNAKNQREARAREFEQRAAESDEAVLERKRFVKQLPRFNTEAEREAFATTPRGQFLQQKNAELEEAQVGAATRAERAKEKLVFSAQRQLALEEQLAIINDKTITRSAKLEKLAALGASAAQRGVADNSLIVGQYGLTGSAAEVRGYLPTYGPGRDATDQANRENYNRAVRDTNIGALAAAEARAAAETDGETSKMAAAWTEGRARIELGIQEVVNALFAGSLKILGAESLGARGKLGEGVGQIFGGAGEIGGGVAKQFGSKLLSGFFTAFIGQAIASIVGEEFVGPIFGKKAGQTVSNIGGAAAIGAGVGSIFGQPLIGAGIGAGVGLLSEVLGGGQEPSSHDKRVKRERKSIEEGAQANAAGIEGLKAELDNELEVAITGEAEAAQNATQKTAQIIAQLGATIRVAGVGSESGKLAIEALAGAAAKAYVKRYAVKPEEAQKADEQYEKAREATNKQASELLQDLPSTRSYSERRELIGAGHDIFAKRRADRAKEEAKLGQEIKAEEKHEADLKRKSDAEIKSLMDEGYTRSEAADEDQYLGALDQAARNLEAKRKSQAAQQKNKGKQEAKEFNDEAKFAEEVLKGEEEKLKAIYSREEARTVEPSAHRKLQQARRATQRSKDIEELSPLGQAGKEILEERDAEREREANEERHTIVKEHRERAEGKGRIRLSRIPTYDVTGRLREEQKIADAALAEVRAHPADFDWKERYDAIIKANEAKRAVDDHLREETRQLREITTQIVKAENEGDPAAQAAADAADAAKAAAEAKNPQEKAAAKLKQVQASNEARQAHIEEIRDRGEELEAGTTDPVRLARIKKKTDEEVAAATHGAEAQRKARTQVKRDNRSLIEATVTKKADDINYDLEMEKISRQQAADAYRRLAKMKGVTAQAAREFLLKAKQLENEGKNEAIFSLKAGDIKIPTVYDEHRSLEEAGHFPAAQAGGIPRVTGQRPQPITGGDTRHHRPPPPSHRDLAEARSAVAHITNNNNLTFIVRSDRDLAQVGDHIERATGANLKARQRAAGHR